MASSPPKPGSTPPKKKPGTPPPFATQPAEDDESAIPSLNAPIPGLGAPLVTSNEEMRKVYSHFAHLAKDPASLKLPKPKSAHLTLEERAEVDMPVPAHKRDPKLLELLKTTETVRSDFKREAVMYWSDGNYQELDDQVKDIIIRNKSLGADTNVQALYPAEVQPGGTGTAALQRKSPTKAVSTWKAAPKELSRWGGQIKSTFEKQEEMKNKRIAKLKKATNKIGQKSKMIGAFKAFGAESLFKSNGSSAWDSSPPSPSSMLGSPVGAGDVTEKSPEERADLTRSRLLEAYGKNADVDPKKEGASTSGTNHAEGRPTSPPVDGSSPGGASPSGASPGSKLKLLMGSKSAPGLGSAGSHNSIASSFSAMGSPTNSIYDKVMAQVKVPEPPHTLEPPDPRTTAILNLKNPVRAVGADDIWITEMKNIIQVHARKALPWQAQMNCTALMALFEQRRLVAEKIEASRVIEYKKEQEALIEHHRRIQMDIIATWRDMIKVDIAKTEEITAVAVAAEEEEDRQQAEARQKELTDIFLDFAAQQIADMNRNEYGHFETDSAKITEKWSLGLVNIELRAEHVSSELVRRDTAFDEMQIHAKKRYHDYDGRVMGLEQQEQQRVEKQTSLAEKRALMRFDDEKKRVRKVRFQEAKRKITAAAAETERSQAADLQERRRVAVEIAVDKAVTEASLEYMLFLLQTMVKPQLSWMENEQIFWRLKVVADQGAEIRRRTTVMRAKDQKEAGKQRTAWKNKLQRWREKVDRGQEELDRLEDERVLLKTKIERHRVAKLLEETKELVDTNAERRWHSLAASRRINFRCIRLLHNFNNEANELNEMEVQRNFAAIITEKVRQDKANAEEEQRIAEAMVTTARIVSEAEELEFRRVSVHEQQSQALAKTIAEDQVEKVKAAEYDDLLNDLDREAAEAKKLVERVPELMGKATQIEQNGWKVSTRDELMGKSKARGKVDVTQDRADELEVSIKEFEPWVEFCSNEVAVLQESQTSEHDAHNKAVEDAAVAAKAFVERELGRVAHEAEHETKSVKKFLKKQADAAELAIDGERYARRYNASKEESQVTIWESEEALHAENFQKSAREMMETIISELVSLAEQGQALSDETMLGINQFSLIKQQLREKASTLFDAPLSLLPRGNIGFFHRVHRRGGDEDSLAAGLMPLSKVEADAMALDELLDMVRNEKLAAESPAVLNMLPQNIFDWVTSAEFEQESSEKFAALDGDKAGILTAADLFQVVCSLTDGSPLAVTEHHCKRFIDAFDSNGDGVIDQGEFAAFIRFLIVATYVDIKNGGPADGDMGDEEANANAALDEEQFWLDKQRVTSLIDDIERDKAMVDEILPQLPKTITDVLASDDFISSCNAKFDELDEDGSGAIEPDELYPILVEMSQGSAWAVDNEHCEKFAALFDVKENGVIDREEFGGFCKFVFIISYLKKGGMAQPVTVPSVEPIVESAQEEEVPFWEDTTRLSSTVAKLQVDPKTLETALFELPEDICAVLASDELDVSVRKRYAEAETSWDPNVMFNLSNIPVQVTTMLTEVPVPPYEVSQEAAAEIVATYADAIYNDKSPELTIAQGPDQLLFVVRYVVVVNYLYRSLEAVLNSENDEPGEPTEIGLDDDEEEDEEVMEAEPRSMEDELRLDRERVTRMIKHIRDDKAMVAQYMAQLPAEVSSVLSSPAFGISCGEKFDALDVNGSGVLEPEQLIPIIVELSHGHKWALTEQHVIDFTTLFDVKQNGVIERDEFRELCAFVGVMRYLDSLAAEHESYAEPGTPGMGDRVPGVDGETFADANPFEDASRMAWRTDDIKLFLKTLRGSPETMDEAITCLPIAISEALTDEKFHGDCMGAWREYVDPQDTGMAMPDELQKPIVDLAADTPWALHGQAGAEETCARHMNTLFESLSGGQAVAIVARDDFPNICRFIFTVAFAESALGIDTEMALGIEGLLRDENRLKVVIEHIKDNPTDLHKMLQRIPGEVSAFFKSRRFAEACYERFDALDNQKEGRKKGNGKVDPALLAPELLELTSHTSWALDGEAQAMDYFATFNANERDHVKRGEFCAFCTYACALNFFRGALQTLQKANEELAIGKDVEEAEDVRVKKLITCLMEERDVVEQILPRLGSEMATFLQSEGFVTMCKRRFNALDTDGSGKLEPIELAPVIKSLLRSSNAEISLDDCIRFASLWDDDKDGVISREEYVPFCRFLVVMSNLEQMALEKDASEDQRLSQEEKEYMLWQEHEEVSDVIEKLVADRDAVFRLRTHLPDGLQEYLVSETFQEDCYRQFDELDADGSGSLEAEELAPVIHELAKDAPHVNPDIEQCKRFMSLFHQSRLGPNNMDVAEDDLENPQGVTRDEFSHLCEFIIVLNYLHYLREAEAEANEAARAMAEVEAEEVWEDSIRVSAMLDNVSKNVRLVEDMLPRLPMKVRRALTGPTFEQTCDFEFGKLDADGNGTLSPDELYPAVCELSEEFAYDVDIEHCQAMAELFDSSKTGTIGRADFVRFCRFLHLTAYLKALSNPATAASALDALLGRTGDAGSQESVDNGGQGEDAEWSTDRVSEIIASMEANRGDMESVLAILPSDVTSHLVSDDFAMMCESKFRGLDADGNGTLSVDELYPVIVEMTSSQPYDVTFEHCRRVGNIFDDDKNGVISVTEFTQFYSFMCITAWLLNQAPEASLGAIEEGEEEEEEEEEGEEEENREEESIVESASSDKIRVDSLLPQLPPAVRATLESADFDQACAKAFDEMDTAEPKAGMLPPGTLGPVIQQTVFASISSVSDQWAITTDHCVRFASLFDAEKNGFISRDEFPQYAILVTVMGFMESSNTMNVGMPMAVAEPVGLPVLEGIAPSTEEQQQFDEAAVVESSDIIEASSTLSQIIDTIKQDKEAVDEFLPQLPPEVLDDLNSTEFAAGSDEKFAEIDQDSNGVLSIEELFPVIEELFQGYSWALSLQHCMEFTAIFDEDGNGQISRSEFLTFCKFLAIMSFKFEEQSVGTSGGTMPSGGANGDEGQDSSAASKSMHLVVPSNIATCPEEFDHSSLLASLLSLPTSSQSASDDHWLPLASLTPGVVDALQAAKVDKQLAPLLLSCAEAGYGGTVSLGSFCNLARFMIRAHLEAADPVMGVKPLKPEVTTAVEAVTGREIEAAVTAMILEAEEIENPRPGVLSTVSQPPNNNGDGAPWASMLSAKQMIMGSAAAVHLTERECNSALSLLAAKAVENEYKDITLYMSIDNSASGSSGGGGESWEDVDELERMEIQASFKEHRQTFLREVLKEVKVAAYSHAARWFGVGPRAIESVKIFLKRRCEAAAVTPVGSFDRQALVPLTNLKSALTELPWVVVSEPMAIRMLSTVATAPRTGVRLFQGVAHLPMHASLKILAKTLHKSFSSEELDLEARMIQEVYDDINIQMPPPSASAGGTTLSSNASTKPRGRKSRPKPAIAVSPAMREMTGFSNVTDLNISLYLSFEELDAVDLGVIPTTVAQMVLDTHVACQKLTSVETAIAMSTAPTVYSTDGSDTEGEYFDGGVSSEQTRELLFYKEFARSAACAIELLCEQRYRGDAMTNKRPLPLPETVKMPDLWMMRLERVACTYVKGMVLGREAFEGMVQQLRLARFSKRSAREAEYGEHLRKEFERVEEMAEAEVERVDQVLVRRAERVEELQMVEVQRVETREMLDNLTRLVAYQEGREALEFLLDSSGDALRINVISERRVLDHITSLEKAEAKVYKVEDDRIEAFRSDDAKARAAQIEARDEKSMERARELNKEFTAWEKDLKKIADDARFESNEIRKKFTERQKATCERLKKELDQRIEELDEKLADIMDAVAAKEEKLKDQIAEELDPDWKNPDIKDRKAEKKLRENLCKLPIPLLEDLATEVQAVFNVAPKAPNGTKSWLDTLYNMRLDEIKESGGESKILLVNARKKFESKFEKEIELEIKAVVKKEDECLATKKQEDAEAMEEYNKMLDEEQENMEELFKKSSADFVELMSSKKSKVREYWEKSKVKQRKANQSRTDATESKVQSLKRQLGEKIREIRPKQEDEACAMRLYEARAKCMTQRSQAYCDEVMSLFNTRSQENELFCKDHFDTVYNRLEPKYKEREEDYTSWRELQTKNLLGEVKQSDETFWEFMQKQYDRSGETKSPMPKLDLLLHQERRRSTQIMDQVAEDRQTFQTKLEDSAFERKKKFNKEIISLEASVLEKLEEAKQRLKDTKANAVGWDVDGNPCNEEPEPAPAPTPTPTPAPASTPTPVTQAAAPIMQDDQDMPARNSDREAAESMAESAAGQPDDASAAADDDEDGSSVISATSSSTSVSSVPSSSGTDSVASSSVQG